MPEYSIPLSVPNIAGNEWHYVKECLDTEWVSSAGKYVDMFGHKIAEYTGAKFAVSCVNDTSALHVALRLVNDSLCLPPSTNLSDKDLQVVLLKQNG